MLLKNSSLLSVLPNSTASWRMRVIYTSKGAMKNVGVRVIYRKTLQQPKCVPKHPMTAREEANNLHSSLERNGERRAVTVSCGCSNAASSSVTYIHYVIDTH
jgi:hypothetical protein